MGLTIHYDITLKGHDDARKSVEAMRQLALDLPFEEVGEIIDLKGAACDFKKLGRDNPYRWLLIQAGGHTKYPWNKNISEDFPPKRVIAFETVPGPGSEPANIGLCLYPEMVEMKYTVKDDRKFQTNIWADSPGSENYEFDDDKWDRHCRRTGRDRLEKYADPEIRIVPTGKSGWSWGSFCKTQYASDPECGGAPNFLRCHISVITLLERIKKLPGIRVKIKDEGKYGPSCYSTDYEEAYAAGRKPTYRRHKGKYDPKALAKEVGGWNEMIAAMAGAFNDAAKAAGQSVVSPITSFPDFESLEFRGSRNKEVGPFLAVMKSLAEKNVEKAEKSS